MNGEVVARTVRTTNFVGPNASVRRHTDDAFRFCRAAGEVVQGRGDDAGHVGAVAVIVHRIAVGKHEVVAAGIVRCQVWVGVVDAGIDHRHRDGGAALGDRPGLRSIDVGVGGAAVEAQLTAEGPGDAVERLTGVVETPLFVEVVIAGDDFRASAVGGKHGDAADEVRLGIKDVRVAPVARKGGCFIARRYANTLDASAGNLGEPGPTSHPVCIIPCASVDPGPELHQDVAGRDRAAIYCLGREARHQTANNQTDSYKSFAEPNEAAVRPAHQQFVHGNANA